MKYRYFYNAQGTILGYGEYRKVCFQTGIVDSVGYIDTDSPVDIDAFVVDIETQTLISIQMNK
jgi:hypothetical protein